MVLPFMISESRALFIKEVSLVWCSVCSDLGLCWQVVMYIDERLVMQLSGQVVAWVAVMQ